MTTKTKERAASSEGTQAHNDKANIALNVKYFKIVHRMSHDAAQAKVQQIIDEGGDLLSNAQCNAAIASFKRDEKRREKAKDDNEAREKAAQERAAQEEKARQEYAEKKAQEEKASTIDDESIQFVNSMVEKGNTVAQIRGYLQFKGYSAKVIKQFIAGLDLKKAPKRSMGERERFMQRFIDAPMSDDEFSGFIKESSSNVQKHESVYRAMFNTFNAIHAHYNK